MIRSFRLRLALLSAVLAGVALCVFGGSAYWLVRDMRIDKLVQEVRENAEREVKQTRGFEDWRRIEAKMADSLGVGNGRQILLLVEGSDGRPAYRSGHWPASLAADDLPWPALAEPKPARPPGASDVGNGRVADTPPAPFPPQPPPVSTAISRNADGHSWYLGLAAGSRARVAVGVDTAFVGAEIQGVRNAFLLALPVALLMIGLGAWVFSSRAIRPLHKLIDATRHISAEKLDQRIPGQGEDREFAELIMMFNVMLERLEKSFRQSRRFSADAAHELKTPLAILQGQLERIIGNVETGSVLQAELSGVLDEVRRLSTISRKLLLLSQADAGGLNLHRQAYDLSGAIADLVEDIYLLAPELSVASRIEAGLSIQADMNLFPQILHNLISNAIKYNTENGWIDITLSAPEGMASLRISNSSQGIPAAEQERLFERFFRADRAHNRRIDGNGLGLSVSREIARAHGGEIEFQAGMDGSACFVLKIPLAR